MKNTSMIAILIVLGLALASGAVVVGIGIVAEAENSSPLLERAFAVFEKTFLLCTGALAGLIWSERS